MKLLVTGGAGYIGSIVAAQLLDAGHDVTVLDHLERGHAAAVPRARAASSRSTCSTPRPPPPRWPSGFDAVLHFAALALVAESVAKPERYHRGNFVGDAEPARRDARGRRQAARVLLDLRGLRRARRGPDAARRCATDPVNAYGASKLAVDRMITDECRAHGLGAVSLRYFNVAGASGDLGEDHEPETHLIPLVLQAAAGRREHVSVFGTDYPTDGRHGGARLHPHRGPRRGPHPRARARHEPGRAPDLQPRQRHRLLGAPGDRGRARRSPAARSRSRRRAGARATRPRWWPRRRRSATSSAGSRASPRSRR